MLTKKDILSLKNKYYKAGNEFYFVEEIEYDYDFYYQVTFIRLEDFLRITGKWDKRWFNRFYSNFFE